MEKFMMRSSQYGQSGCLIPVTFVTLLPASRHCIHRHFTSDRELLLSKVTTPCSLLGVGNYLVAILKKKGWFQRTKKKKRCVVKETIQPNLSNKRKISQTKYTFKWVIPACRNQDLMEKSVWSYWEARLGLFTPQYVQVLPTQRRVKIYVLMSSLVSVMKSFNQNLSYNSFSKHLISVLSTKCVCLAHCFNLNIWNPFKQISIATGNVSWWILYTIYLELTFLVKVSTYRIVCVAAMPVKRIIDLNITQEFTFHSSFRAVRWIKIMAYGGM